MALQTTKPDHVHDITKKDCSNNVEDAAMDATSCTTLLRPFSEMLWT
jgi:hypothetical protein